jgi:hypothetical protein
LSRCLDHSIVHYALSIFMRLCHATCRVTASR